MTTGIPIESQVIKPRGLIEFPTKLVGRRGLARRRRRRDKGTHGEGHICFGGIKLDLAGVFACCLIH
jgi:hypothetical protein